MGLRDRLRLLVRPPARAEAALPRPQSPRAAEPVGPPPISIPTRVEQVPPGVPVVDVATVSPAQWSGLRGPVVVVSAGDRGARASAVAERIAALGVTEVSWLAGERP